jgi:HEAT repeat protein
VQGQEDSLYRLGREALNRGDYREAVARFRAQRERYPKSASAGEAHYWEAYALEKLGSKDDLKQALALLDRQAERYPDARSARDARQLRVQIRGDLAQLGDPESAEIVTGIGEGAGKAPKAGKAPVAGVSAGPGSRNGNCDEQDDERLLALHALLQMRAEQAVPILKKVLERRDEGSVCLRRAAMFLVSQKRSPETTEILLGAARGDPDAEVREQAIFWLSQVNTPEAVAALDSILQSSTDPEVQEKAVFALSQQRSEAASRALRAHLERPGTPEGVKENIVFWLGQKRSPENAQYLKELYARTSSPELKEKILFSISQMPIEENGRWLLDIALDQSSPVELRKNALFWAGQMKSVNLADLTGLYDRTADREMKEQLIFAYSQRKDPAAVDKLMDIVRNEPDKDLRGKALFWLGQSNDPRVAQFLLEVINK